MDINIGKKINLLRMEKGYTQEDLAQLCAVSSAAVSKWERNQTYPDINTLPVLARIFNITIDELLNFEEQIDIKKIDQLVNEMVTKFQNESFEEAFAFCKKIIHTYPNSEMLKLKVAGAGMYITMALYTKENAEADSNEFQAYAKTLCESLISCSDLTIRQSACIMLSTFASTDKEVQEALDLFENIPALSSTTSLKSSLYMQLQQYDKAAHLLQTQLYTDSSTMLLMLFSLADIALHENRCEDARSILSLIELLNEHLLVSTSTVTGTSYMLYARCKDRDNTLKALRRYIAQFQHIDKLTSSVQAELNTVPWFSTVKLHENPSAAGMSAYTVNIVDMLRQETALEFLQNDPEFIEILHELDHASS